MSDKILVISELKNEELRNVSFEAIAAAKQLSASGEIVAALIADTPKAEQAKELIYYGADRVIQVYNEQLKNYTSEGYGQALLPVIEEEKPDGIIMGHTAIGKDLTPKLASQLNLALISDVVEITKDREFVRPIYSGKAFEKKIITEGIPFITIRPNNIAAPDRNESKSGEVTAEEKDIKDLRTIVKDIVRKTSEGVDLSEANVIVAGGRGVKSKEGFNQLYELADLLGGAVGASRGACDAEYCDYALQIGQTGKVVTPDLYIAVGISGAIQHLAGMSNSKVIVAINKDSEANIFNVADYGITGDLFEVIPLLIEEIKQLNKMTNA